MCEAISANGPIWSVKTRNSSHQFAQHTNTLAFKWTCNSNDPSEIHVSTAILYISFNFIRARNFKRVTNFTNMKHFKIHSRYHFNGQLNDFTFIEVYGSIELKHLLYAMFCKTLTHNTPKVSLSVDITYFWQQSAFWRTYQCASDANNKIN